MKKAKPEDRESYEMHVKENWKETFPIMKDVSRFAKIRPKDGVEFSIMI